MRIFMIKSLVHTDFFGDPKWWSARHSWVGITEASVYLNEETMTSKLPPSGEWVAFESVKYT